MNLIEPPLFWQHEYASLHRENHKLLELHDESRLSRNLIFPFRIIDRVLKCPGIGTFGGIYSTIEISDWQNVWEKVLFHFPGVHEFEISFPPKYFLNQLFESQIQACIDLFDPSITVETNHHVVLDSDPATQLSKGNRKKLRQFRELGGRVENGQSSDFETIYKILEDSRRRLGVELSMTKPQLEEALGALPTHYKTYKAIVGTEIIAGAVVVKLNSETQYVLYWGDSAEAWRHVSPVVALYVAIFKESMDAGYIYLDLGISSLNGQLNTGLSRFKENLGSIKSDKIKLRFYNPINNA
jgi:hypothetical protein